MSLSIDLSGKTAIVTGGGRGIGRSIALALAQAGADVAVTARTRSQIAHVAEEIRAMGRKSLAVETDVTISDQVDRMVEITLDTLGGLHILVNNAGTIDPSPLLDCTEGQWDQVVDTNLKSLYLCTRPGVLRQIPILPLIMHPREGLYCSPNPWL